MRRLMNLAGELEEAFELIDAETLTPQIVAEIAEEIGAPKVHVYAAAAMMTEIACDASAAVRFELCIGGCQSWGAAELLRHLLKRHAQRQEAGAPLFGVVAKRCLDKCERAAVVLVHTPDGTAGLAAATIEQLDEALATALD